MFPAVLSLLVPAFAQDTAVANAATDDLEYREVEIEETDKKLEASAFFEVQWHEFNDLDFRKRDESSDQAILDSDDRNNVAFTGIALNLSYQPDPQIRFVLGASHRGLWGADQFGGTNVFGGWAYFNAAYVDLLSSQGDSPVRFRVGRQFYKIGGLGRTPDFTLADVLDMVRVDIPIGDVGQLTLIPIDSVSSASADDGANFARFNAQSTLETFGFRGDRMTRRHGAVLDLDRLGPAGVKAYGFFTDIGALGTGSDISFDGRSGNFTDNDWVANYGVRAEVDVAEMFTFFGGLDGSFGIDRKELVANDVNTNGFAITAGADFKKDAGDGAVVFNAYYHYALGATFGEDGLQTSHGYVGMKGQQVGGLLSNRYMGWHPSAYVGLFGVDDTPMEMDRKSGTSVLALSGGYEGKVSVLYQAWVMADTGFTNFNFDEINEIQPPFGYSREEYAAQIRHGRSLGAEMNLSVGYAISDRVSLRSTGALMFNNTFYSIPISRVAGSALGSSDPQTPWGIMGGLRVSL